MRRDIQLKKVHLVAPLLVVMLYANLAWAQTPVQESTGSGGADSASANYQVKAAVGDAGVGESQSTNYIYNHGTLWFDDVPAYVPPPIPLPTPISGGGGGSSGSGWLVSLLGGNPQIGGISPEVDVPFTDTPEAAAVITDIPQSSQSAVRVESAPAAINRALNSPRFTPQVIRLVDDTGVTRELNIVLFKRIMPWLLWIALLIIIVGAVLIMGFIGMRGAKEYLLRVGVVLVLIGVVMGIIVRFAYRAVPIDTKAITSITVVSVSEASAIVKRLMTDLPLGVHVVEATNSLGKKVLTVRVFITPALPI